MGGGQLVGGSGQVDAVGCCGDGDVGPGVDEKLRSTGGHGDGLKDLASESGDGGGGKIFFAELDKVDAFGNPARGLTEERCLLLKLAAWIQGAAGDGVATHG